MTVQNIHNIKHSQIKIFPFQTKDHSFILFPDLPTAYLLTLLIDKLNFQLDQFSFEYIYPTNKCVDGILTNMWEYDEKYFIFYLENYFHSSDYAMGFLERVLQRIEELEHPPFLIIHTIKTPKNEIIELIEKHKDILLVINWDFEDFFYKFFYKQNPIEEIWNIYYRDDNARVIVNEDQGVKANLDDFILPAYASGYYAHFPKNKDHIISIVDDDDELTDDNIYYRQSKDKFVKGFRYYPETEIMLTTGRGCLYNCSYCYRWAKYSTVRQISLETLKIDLDYLKELQYEYIYFYDDCFVTTNLNRMDEIVELLSQYPFEYGIAARYEVCTPNNLMKLAKINIKRIQVGLQSISMEVNKDTKRWFRKEAFEKTVQKMKTLGIGLSLDIILGLPWEWLKGFLKTFNYAVWLNPVSIFINSLFLNPGTELYDRQQEYGIVTTNTSGKRWFFHVDGIKYSDNFSEDDILFARKYVSYYKNKIPHINITLR